MKIKFPIVFAVDDYYVPIVGVALHSMVIHAMSPNVEYKVFILHLGIKEEAKKYLQKLVQFNSQITLQFVQVNDRDLSNNRKNKKPKNKAPLTMEYLKLLIPKIFTKYDQVIYLNPETVFTIDPYALAGIDVGEHLCAGVSDIPELEFLATDNLPESFIKYFLNQDYEYREIFEDHCANNLEIDDIYSYINTGVLLFNLKKIRELKLQDAFFKQAHIKRDLMFPQQDAINYVVNQHGGAKLINRKFNLRMLNLEWVAYQQPDLKKLKEFNYTPTICCFLDQSVDEYLFNLPRFRGIFNFGVLNKPWLSNTNSNAQMWWACITTMPNSHAYWKNFPVEMSEQEKQVINALGRQYFSRKTRVTQR